MTLAKYLDQIPHAHGYTEDEMAQVVQEMDT